MSFFHLNKRNAVRIGALLAPVAVMQLTPVLLAPTPSMARAGSIDPMASVENIFAAPKATPEQEAAIAHAKYIRAAPITNNPFHFLPQTAVITDTDPGESEPGALPGEFRVTSITGSGATTLAVIDGKVRRVGEELAPGVYLDGIDPESRSITIRDSNGEVTTLALFDSESD